MSVDLVVFIFQVVLFCLAFFLMRLYYWRIATGKTIERAFIVNIGAVCLAAQLFLVFVSFVYVIL